MGQSPLDILTKTDRLSVLFLLCLMALWAFVLWPIQALKLPFWDGGIVLVQTILHSPSEYFTDPDAYNVLSPTHLTPSVTLSWELDYWLSGIDSRGFYIHQIVSGVLFVGLFYVLLKRLTSSKYYALFFGILGLLIPSILVTMSYPTFRHYVEGAILAILCMLGFQNYIQSGKTRYLLLSTLCYALSSTFKEIFLPLPGLLFLLPAFQSDLRADILYRLRLMMPFVIVLVGYLVWRYYLLGSLVGYSMDHSAISRVGKFKIFYRSLFSSTSQLWVCTIVILMAPILIKEKKWHRILIGLTAFVLAFLPIYFLLPQVLDAGPGRWGFSVSIVGLSMLAVIVSRSEKAIQYGLVAVLSIVFLPEFSKVVIKREYIIAFMTPFDPVARFVEQDKAGYTMWVEPDNFMVSANVPSWRYAGFLKKGYWGTPHLSHPAELHYRDFEGQKWNNGQPQSVEALKAVDIQMGQNLQLKLSPSVSDDTYKIEFKGLDSNSAKCSLYFFDENQSLIIEHSNCNIMSIDRKRLRHQLSSAGLFKDDVQFAFWVTTKDGQYRLSKATKSGDFMRTLEDGT